MQLKNEMWNLQNAIKNANKNAIKNGIKELQSNIENIVMIPIKCDFMVIVTCVFVCMYDIGFWIHIYNLVNVLYSLLNNNQID